MITDHLHLVFKNAIRNRRRTTLTVSSVAVSLFLLVSLRTLVIELQGDSMLSAQANVRLITRHAISLQVALPLAMKAKIEKIPGVEWVSEYQWYPTYWKDPKNIFVLFAVNPEIAGRDPDYKYDRSVMEAFKKERSATIVPEKMMKRFGWKVGQRITFAGSVLPFDIPLVIRGVYTGPNETSPIFRFDYFNEIAHERMPQRGDKVTSFWTKVRSVEDAGRVAKTIDAMFENTDTPTRTESEKGFVHEFTAMLGNVKLFISMIAAAVVFAILLVTTNTMAMAVRERTNEIAVLKAIGFRRGQILALLVAESIAIAITGAVLGISGAVVFFHSIDIYQLTQGIIQHFDLRGGTIALGSLVGVAMGLLSAIPAWSASRLPIAETLRRL
jgi:putative ABC transport system permease protein